MEIKNILRILIVFHIQSTLSGTENTYLNALKEILAKQKHFLEDNEENYNQCVMFAIKNYRGIDRVFGPFFEFQGEGLNVEFECSLCYPNSEIGFTWWSLTLFNEKHKLKNSHKFLISEGGKKLIINNPKIQDSLTYFCVSSSNLIAFNVFTLELLPIRKLNKINVRNGPKQEVSETRRYHNLEISTIWTTWSSCSRCGTAGRKHKFGLCIIRQLSTGKYNDFEFMTLKTFPFISCSLFLFLNPEIGNNNQKLIQLLTKDKGKVILGYCRIPCGKLSKDTELEEIPPDLITLYQQNDQQSKGNDMGYLSILPPWGKEHITAIVCFFALIVIQIIFIIRICKNKRSAI